MATSLILNDITRSVVWCQLAEQAGLMVLHHQVRAMTGLGGFVEDIPNAVQIALTPALVNVLSDKAKFQGVVVNRVASFIGGLAGPFFSTTLPTTGQVAGETLPRQVSGIITKRTGFPGPAGRGRAYVPFPGEADSDTDGNPTAGYHTRLDILAAAMLAPVVVGGGPDTSTLNLCIPYLSQFTSRIVTVMQARGKWATQRRRGSYGKANVSPF